MTFSDTLSFEPADDHLITTVSDQWMVGQMPNGGYLSALALAAARTIETDLDRPLRSANFQFVGRLTPGEQAQVTVQEIRRGGAMTAVDVAVHQRDRVGLTARCLFLPNRPGPELANNTAPVIPSPEALGPNVHDAEPDSLRSRYDTRYAIGGFPPDEFDEAEVTGWIRPLPNEPIGETWLTAIADAWAPPVIILRGLRHLARTIDMQLLMRHTGFEPIDDFVLGRSVTRTLAEGYVEQDTDIWSRDGVLLCQARQLGMMAPFEPDNIGSS